jgi:hypothetical protein
MHYSGANFLLVLLSVAAQARVGSRLELLACLAPRRTWDRVAWKHGPFGQSFYHYDVDYYTDEAPSFEDESKGQEGNRFIETVRGHDITAARDLLNPLARNLWVEENSRPNHRRPEVLAVVTDIARSLSVKYLDYQRTKLNGRWDMTLNTERLPSWLVALGRGAAGNDDDAIYEGDDRLRGSAVVHAAEEEQPPQHAPQLLSPDHYSEAGHRGSSRYVATALASPALAAEYEQKMTSRKKGGEPSGFLDFWWWRFVGCEEI